MYKYTVLNMKTLKGVSQHNTYKAAQKSKVAYVNKHPSKKKDIQILIRIDKK